MKTNDLTLILKGRRILAAVAVGAISVALFAPVAGADPVSPTIMATLTGQMPSFAVASGTVSVMGMPDMSGMTVGSSVDFVPLATQPVSGSSFSIPVALTPTVQSWLGGFTSPTANALVIIKSGTSMTAETVVIPVASSSSTTTTTTVAPGSPVTIESAGPPVVTTSAFPAPWAYSTTSPETTSANALRHSQAVPSSTGSAKSTSSPNYSFSGCNAVLESNQEQSTRIGELHVANQTGETARYYYENYADSTITAGISASDSGFTLDGSVSVTNAISTNASQAEGAGVHPYIDSNFLYGNFLVSLGTCGYFYVVMAYDAVGDVFAGNQAPDNPWGSCSSDPNLGTATVGPGGAYGTHSETAANYGAVASFLGFTFGATTGYSTTIDINWHNAGTVNSYVCGNNGPANSASILYNNPS
jgi:hypothetical protein